MKKIRYAGGRLAGLIARNMRMGIPYDEALDKLQAAGGLISRENGKRTLRLPSWLAMEIPNSKSRESRKYFLELTRGLPFREPLEGGRILAKHSLFLKLSATQCWTTGKMGKVLRFNDSAGEVARIFGFEPMKISLPEEVVWLPVPPWVKPVGWTGMLMNEDMDEGIYGVASLALFASDAAVMRERFIWTMDEALAVPL